MQALLKKFLFLSPIVAFANSYELDTLTVSASPVKASSIFEAISKVESIDANTKRLNVTNSLGGLLSDIVGINSISTGSQTGKPVIRGVSGERIKILSNSKPTDFHTYGIRHTPTIDLFSADSVEVISGAYSVLYGSEASGGVVNIVPHKLTYSKEMKTKGDLLLGYSSNNKEKMRGVKLDTSSGNFSAFLAVSKTDADNLKTPKVSTYKAGDAPSHKPLFSGELPFTNFEIETLTAIIGYKIDSGEITARHSYYEGYQNFLAHKPTPPYSPISSAGQKLTNGETNIEAKLLFGEWLIKPSFAHTKNSRIAATGEPFWMLDTKKDLQIEIDRDDYKLAALHPNFLGFDGEIGIEFFNKKQDLKLGYLAPTADENGFGVYIFEEREMEKTKFQFGARYEKKDISAPLDGTNATFVKNGIFNSTNNKREFNAGAVSVGALQKISDNLNLSASISRGFRFPSIFELYAGGVHGGVQAYQIGNPELKPEITDSIEIRAKYRDKNFYATASAYTNSVKDYIYLYNTGRQRDQKTGAVVVSGGLIEMKNAQTDALIRGIEIDTGYKLTDTLKAELKLELLSAKELSTHKNLFLLPPNNLYAKLTNSFTFGELSIGAKGVAKRSVSSQSEPFAQYNKTPFGSADTDGYWLFDASFKKEFLLGKNRATLKVTISNLFDIAYRDYLDTYKGYALSQGRNISALLGVNF